MKMSKSVKSKLSLLLALVMLSVPALRLYAVNDNNNDDTSDDPFGSSEITASDAFADFENKDISMFFLKRLTNRGHDSIIAKDLKMNFSFILLRGAYVIQYPSA